MEDQPIKSLKDMGIPKEKVEGLFACNSTFTGPGPAAGEGMNQADVDKWWTGQKAQLVNQVVFDLRKCELLEGNEFATEVAFIVHRKLPTMNIMAKCGWRRVWKAVLRKARAKAYQDLEARNAVPISVAAQQAAFQAELQAMLKKIKDKAAS